MSPLAALEHTILALAIALVIGAALELSRIAIALPVAITALVAGSIVVLVALVANHVAFPFHLDLMEGVTQQHARRALHGQSIYPLASPEFVPLAYNALFYILAAPFLLVFGDSLATLRMVSVIGFAGSAAAIFALVKRASRSNWWAAIAIGLFAAAYSAMDAYLDTAHSDAWLLCCALWGTYLVSRASRGSRITGVLVLVAAFWFKQHGAVFLGAALVYLTWTEGLAKSIPYWLLAIVLGPVLYVLAPGSLLGPGFHFFTWHVPSGWSQFGGHTIPRVVIYLASYYPVIALAALLGAWRATRQRAVGILELELGAAFLTALMGSLDPGSSYNVFISMGAFSIVCGTIELARLQQEMPARRGVRVALVAVLLAFASLLHDPRAFWLPGTAKASYADLQSTLGSLPGTVYAPGIAALPDGVTLYPGAHWVALDDMMRGPHRTASDSALSRSVLDPIRHPAKPAYVLTNHPLDSLAPPVSELAASYTLVQDYGARFSALQLLPRRFDHAWPRYLYRSASAGDSAHAP